MDLFLWRVTPQEKITHNKSLCIISWFLNLFSNKISCHFRCYVGPTGRDQWRPCTADRSFLLEANGTSVNNNLAANTRDKNQHATAGRHKKPAPVSSNASESSPAKNNNNNRHKIHQNERGAVARPNNNRFSAGVFREVISKLYPGSSGPQVRHGDGRVESRTEIPEENATRAEIQLHDLPNLGWIFLSLIMKPKCFTFFDIIRVLL